MSNYIFIIDTNKKPCNPVHPGKARHLLKSGQAAVFRRYPFTLILKTESTELAREIQVKIDPGSKTTGIALTQGAYVIWGGELTHRGQAIKVSLESRKSLRRGRRNRHTPYRQPRFLNRTRRDGWLAPSLQHG
jgi:RRXRR protein